jgi:hypothetical protein
VCVCVCVCVYTHTHTHTHTLLHSYFMTVWILDKEVKLEDGETSYTRGVEGGRILSVLLVTDRRLN